ncbi:MAG: endolytic transglycosylase MltG [Chloroflexi bacterium]|nr:endolytic transglycosylase MltG [Chloroflexota bacterium]
MIRMFRRLFWLSLLVLLLAVPSLVGSSQQVRDRLVEAAVALLEPGAPQGESVIAFTVRPGEGGGEIAARLAQEGLIRNPNLFRFLLSYYGAGGALQAGRYSLPPGLGPREIIQMLMRGQVDLVAVTVPEGWRAEEVADLLEASGIARRTEFLRLVFSTGAGGLPPTLAPPVPVLEGYLFPDTYIVPREHGAEAFLRLMVNTFQERFTPEMLREAQAQGLTVHQAVVLASIVEREAAKPEERPLIAGVLLNRLREGLPLAADPTVQYTLVAPGAPPPAGGYWKAELTADDLRAPSAYNTYVTPGLPPAPIASPGLSALQAVLRPQSSPYRYFVARPDGSHAFAATFEEHLRNVAQYRR